MKKAFDFEGPVFIFLSKVADLIWLNCLFLICSIPLFTIGASITAMYYVTLKMVKDEEGYVTKSFFKSFKDNFKQATAIWLIVLLVGTILFMDFKIVTNSGFAGVVPNAIIGRVVGIATILVSVFFVFVCIYVFPILAKFDNSIKNTIKNAFLMSIRHLPFSVLLIMIHIAPVILMYASPKFYIIVFIMFSLVAICSSKLLSRIFDMYIPVEEPGEKDEEET